MGGARAGNITFQSRGGPLKGSILLLEIVKYNFLGMNKKQRSCDGRRGGRAASPFGVLMSPKRRVRAAHGRARAAKTH
jgi:hypothetical protein